MTDKQYVGFLAILVIPAMIAQVVKATNWSEEDATKKLYESKFYEKLAYEKLKLRHYSPLVLSDMFVEYEKTGEMSYPEGGAI